VTRDIFDFFLIFFRVEIDSESREKKIPHKINIVFT